MIITMHMLNLFTLKQKIQSIESLGPKSENRMVDAKTGAIKFFISDFSRRGKSPWYRLLYKALLLPMTDSSAGFSYILQFDSTTKKNMAR